MDGRFVIYYRVSTDKQGRSGLGLEAQRETVMRFLNGGNHEVVSEYTEVESGGKDDRPELTKAIRDCRLKNAKLIVSKLDRLSRDLGFITDLQKSGVQFVIADMPDATELTIHIYAAMAQHERRLVSQRTKEALARVKANGKQLGNPCLLRGEQIPGSGDTSKANAVRVSKARDFAAEIKRVIQELCGETLSLGDCASSKATPSLREIAECLNQTGYRTARGSLWHPTSVKRILDRQP